MKSSPLFVYQPNRLTLFAAAVLVGTLGLTAPAQAASAVGEKVDDFRLKDIAGAPRSLADYRESKLVVLAFIGTECPLAKLYAPRLASMAKKYEPSGVAFLGVSSNQQDSIAELGALARDSGIQFPILKDLGNELADKLGAARTPEVYVLDADRVVSYRGRIDDQYAIGVSRSKATANNLADAIDELLAGKPVTTPTTEASGCLIGRIRKPKPDAKVTYSDQVVRILQNRCVECHREGEIGPFAMSSYSEVAGWAGMIREVVDEGRMPPWHASAEYGKFAGERRLSDDEKETIRQWVRDGAPEGDPKKLPEPRKFTEGWQLSRAPDLIVPMRDTPYTVQAEGAVRYQYFVVDPGFKEDKWMQAAEVQPGNRAVVHHILILARQRGGGRQSGDDGGAGGFLAAYVPGLRAKAYPEGMAKRIPAGARFVFQVHYTPNGSPQTDLSRLGIWFADEPKVTHEVVTKSAASRWLFIPPKTKDHRVEATSNKLANEALLLTMMPHMHLRGQSFQYAAIFPDGKRETLLDVPHFDFNWQTHYRLAEPRTLPAGTRIHGIAQFDNSPENLNNPDPTKMVRWGDQTWEEMMIGYFDVAFPKGSMKAEPPPANRAALPNRSQLTVDSLLTRFDADRDGVIAKSEVPDRLLAIFEQLDANKDGKLNREELKKLEEFAR